MIALELDVFLLLTEMTVVSLFLTKMTFVANISLI